MATVNDWERGGKAGSTVGGERRRYCDCGFRGVLLGGPGRGGVRWGARLGRGGQRWIQFGRWQRAGEPGWRGWAGGGGAGGRGTGRGRTRCAVARRYHYLSVPRSDGLVPE